MNSWTTKKDTKIFQVLSGRSNSYLIAKNDKSILVDTGKETAYTSLLRNIEKLELKNKNISFLFLTHTHFDHCQSAKLIKDRYNCKLIVSEKAVNSIENGYTVLPNGTFLSTKLIAKLGRLFGKRKYGYKSFQPDFLFNGDNLIQIESFDIEIIETAGHSEDSISIIIDNEIAIVGDAMFGVFKNSVFPPYADNIKDMIQNWGKLLNTDCDIFLPGHGKEINRNLLEKEYNKYARKHSILYK